VNSFLSLSVTFPSSKRFIIISILKFFGGYSHFVEHKFVKKHKDVKTNGTSLRQKYLWHFGVIPIAFPRNPKKPVGWAGSVRG
jgi:hypothetical protein